MWGNIIGLQCYVGFCSTTKRISHTYIYISTPRHPILLVITERWAEFRLLSAASHQLSVLDTVVCTLPIHSMKVRLVPLAVVPLSSTRRQSGRHYCVVGSTSMLEPVKPGFKSQLRGQASFLILGKYFLCSLSLFLYKIGITFVS